MDVVVVNDVFTRYNLLCEGDTIHVECETCDEIVASFQFSEIKEDSTGELYERIIEEHKEV